MRRGFYRRTFLQFTGLTAGAVLLAAACGQAAAPAGTAEGPEDYANPGLLVDTDWLEANLGNENLRIIDVRSPDEYVAGHVKNAINIHSRSFIDPDHEVSGMVLPPDKFAALVGDLGIGNDQEVVVYGSGNILWATRVFWALELYGHKNAKVLNGGFAKWAEEGRATTTDVPTFAATTFTVDFDPFLVATIDEVQTAISNEDSGVVILDNRSAGEYTGRDARSDRGGHIPGAVNQDWVVYLNGTDARTLKSASELTALFASVGITEDTEVMAHCQTAVRSSVAYFVARLLGYNNVQNYDGAWSEWGNNPDVPVNTGSNP